VNGESPEIFVADARALTQRFVSDFTTEGQRALGNRPAFSVALPGGSVATTFFPSLARARFDWSRTEIFWADERIVPFSDPESNYGAALSLLLRPAGIPAERIHPMPVEDVDVRAAAAAYSTELLRVIGNPPRLDFVLLGVGPDGHIASLFPHGRALDDRGPVAIVDDAPKAPKRRMTLTMPVLRGADRIVVAAFGESKREALSDALSQPQSAIPLAMVMREKARVLLLLDPEAASGIRLKNR
jgi:6-phosphogluconolactonase